ncbi:inositol-3-phosphate synthase [Lentzea sp. NPDC058436]|uniref:inositol-3-phosphate synthase n=1 Tax=Lentzea sp. NPDC058436 TaxID=3346499 RepID=UPI00364C78CF
MFVGLAGSTASTAVATLLESIRQPSYLRSTTTTGPLEALDLRRPDGFRFGGWDFDSRALDAVCDGHGIVGSLHADTRQALSAIRPMSGIRTNLDIEPRTGFDNFVQVTDVGEAVDRVAEDIGRFTTTAGADSAIVFYTGSPHADDANDPVPVPNTWEELRATAGVVPSSVVYALGAIRAGAHFVDFTPGRCLDSALVHRLAAEHAVQLAGRDGSTGQTMLKMALGELLKSRGFRVRGWYSTNVIGNHDGYVLSLPQHAVVKLSDKSDGLPKLLGYDDFDHHVSIDYVPHWGDHKESWDAISIEGWAGSRLDIRVNWRGADSMLASAMLFDLARLLDYGARFSLSGLRHEVGYFFKRPLGREGVAPGALLKDLVGFYTALRKA